MRRRSRLSRFRRAFARVRVTRIGGFAVLAGLIAGCATSGASTSQASTTCGRSLTSVNVAVVIKIGRGPVSCATALRVEKSYAALIRAGDVHGNGGGAPVRVNGWTCQGYPSAEIVQNDRVSACTRNGSDIYAWLPPPASTAVRPPVPS